MISFGWFNLPLGACDRLQNLNVALPWLSIHNYFTILSKLPGCLIDYGKFLQKMYLLFRLDPDGQESDDNTASVAGWSAAAILGILLTVIGLLFLLHRYDRLPCTSML